MHITKHAVGKLLIEFSMLFVYFYVRSRRNVEGTPKLI